MDEQPVPLLTDRQKHILAIIERHVSDYGRPPTIREIGAKAGISSTSVVNYHLNKLRSAGLVDRSGDVARGTQLSGTVVLRYGGPATVRTSEGEIVTGELVRDAA